MPRLIWVFGGRTLTSLVLSWGDPYTFSGTFEMCNFYRRRLVTSLQRNCLNTARRLSKIIDSYSLVNIWAPSNEFVSSSILSWQILTAHSQPFRRARDLAFCLKVPLDSLLVWASSGGSGKTARMRRLAWIFAARIGDKYQIRLMRPIYSHINFH